MSIVKWLCGFNLQTQLMVLRIEKHIIPGIPVRPGSVMALPRSVMKTNLHTISLWMISLSCRTEISYRRKFLFKISFLHLFDDPPGDFFLLFGQVIHFYEQPKNVKRQKAHESHESSRIKSLHFCTSQNKWFEVSDSCRFVGQNVFVSFCFPKTRADSWRFVGFVFLLFKVVQFTVNWTISRNSFTT